MRIPKRECPRRPLSRIGWIFGDYGICGFMRTLAPVARTPFLLVEEGGTQTRKDAKIEQRDHQGSTLRTLHDQLSSFAVLPLRLCVHSELKDGAFREQDARLPCPYGEGRGFGFRGRAVAR